MMASRRLVHLFLHSRIPCLHRLGQSQLVTTSGKRVFLCGTFGIGASAVTYWTLGRATALASASDENYAAAVDASAIILDSESGVPFHFRKSSVVRQPFGVGRFFKVGQIFMIRYFCLFIGTWKYFCKDLFIQFYMPNVRVTVVEFLFCFFEKF